MDRETLDRLSRDELLELLAQQAEVIGRQQEELAARAAAIERRDEKIRELEEELARFRRPAKTPESSAVPPSRGPKATRAAGRRRKLGPKAEAARLQRRYRLHRDGLYVFLHRDDVEPTNNSSERDLRPSVIHRKVIGGFRSVWGAAASAIRTTILANARKQGRNLFDAFPAVAGPSPPRAIPAGV